MNRRSILSVSATIALGLALFGITAGSTARAAEIKLLCAVALHPAIDALIPDFEKSSGHKVTVAYGNAGAIADRFQKGEAADLVINAAPLMDQLRAQGKVVAGDRIITGAEVREGFTVEGLVTEDGRVVGVKGLKSSACWGYPGVTTSVGNRGKMIQN